MSTPRTGLPDRDDKTVLGLDRLITMANQIGDFFAPYPPERRAEGIRNHLRTYWDPRMRADLLAYIEAGGDGLKSSVVEGALLLKSGADQTGYYGPPQDAETRRIAGAGGVARRGHNPA
jgi:formate dehydrogenase subunit delta